MVSEKQLEANRQNALQSTGPRTSEGVQAVKSNALRHGLRSVQTVVLGEDPNAWETHRAAIVDDLKPVGAVEHALAESVAAKLWRLGRVVRFEADVIGNAQDADELMHKHETTRKRAYGGPARTDIPTRADVEDVRKQVAALERKFAERSVALGQLQALDGMADDDSFDDWTLYKAIETDFRFSEDRLAKLFKDEDDDAFRARHARKMILAIVGKQTNVEALGSALAEAWTIKHNEMAENLRRLRSKQAGLTRRYKAALERLERAQGIPDETTLNKIQRYETHLERGLHKALERLQALQEARGANPTTINLAVVRGACQEPEMASFGNSAIALGTG